MLNSLNTQDNLAQTIIKRPYLREVHSTKFKRQQVLNHQGSANSI